MKQQLQQLLLSEKSMVLADQGIVSASAFITNILLARALGLTGFGQFSGMVLAQLFMLSLFQAATSSVYQVLYPALSAQQKQSYKNGLFYLQLLLSSSLCLFAMAIVWGFNLPAAGFWAIAATLLCLQQDFLRKTLLTQKQAKQTLYIDVLTNLLQLGALLLLWQYASLNLSRAWSCIGLSFIPSVLAGIYYLQPGKPAIQHLRFAWACQRPHSGWLLLTAAVQWGAGNYYIVAAGWWLGAPALGALRLAQYIFGLLNVLFQALENYVLPLAAQYRTTSNRQLQYLLNRVLKHNILFMLPVLLLLSFFAKPILSFAGGSSYAAYAFVMHGLSALYLLIALGYPVRIGIRASLLNQQYLTGYVIAALFSLVSAPVLIQNWQLYGVLAGLFATQLATLTYWTHILNQLKIVTWKLFTLS